MNFTEEEKKAVIWSVLALAEIDGSKTRAELNKITDVSMVIDFNTSWSTLESVNKLQPSDVYATFRSMSVEKKAFVKKSLEEVATSDGEINHLEKEGLFQMNYFGEL